MTIPVVPPSLLIIVFIFGPKQTTVWSRRFNWWNQGHTVIISKNRIKRGDSTIRCQKLRKQLTKLILILKPGAGREYSILTD